MNQPETERSSYMQDTYIMNINSQGILVLDKGFDLYVESTHMYLPVYWICSD